MSAIHSLLVSALLRISEDQEWITLLQISPLNSLSPGGISTETAEL